MGKFRVSGAHARVCKGIAERQKRGADHYEDITTLNGHPVILRAWLERALTECMDQAVYLQTAIDHLDGQITKRELAHMAKKKNEVVSTATGQLNP